MDAAAFARYFDAQYRTFAEDLNLWLALAVEHGGPLLELGCGTGRVVRPLIQAGQRVIGIDRDPHMLARARTHLAPYSPENACLVQADLGSFAFHLRFKIAISAMNTLCTFDDPGLTAVFRNVSRHLAGGGLLAFEIPNPAVDPFEKVDPHEPLTSFIEPESGNPCQVYAQRLDGIAQDQVGIRWHYDELSAEGSNRRCTLHHRYYLRSAERIRELLDGANFIGIETYGSYARTPFEDDAETMIVIARTALP